MVEALVELGHRQIAFLAGPRALIVSQRRLDGYRQGLESAGIPYDERLVLRTTFDRDGGALAVDALLGGEAPFTAICCANDLLALGALARLAERGIQVPGDVSVAGFDDIAVAAMTAPSLSTVRLPLRELGRRGYHHADRCSPAWPRSPRPCPPSLCCGPPPVRRRWSHCPRPCCPRPRCPPPFPLPPPLQEPAHEPQSPGPDPRLRDHVRRRRAVRRGGLPPLPAVAAPAGPRRPCDQRRHGRGTASLAGRAGTRAAGRRGRGRRRAGHRGAVRAVHGAGRGGGEARRGRGSARPARVPDPRLPGHAARPGHPGRVPRGDRPRLWPAAGRVPAPARAGRRGVRGGDRCAGSPPSTASSPSRRPRSTPACISRRAG